MATGGLDGDATNDALAVDVDAELGLDGLDDLLRGDGAKELALLADLRVDLHELLVEDSLGGLGVGDALGLALGDAVAALLELLEVARGGRLGDLVAEEVVLRIALGHVDDVALSALAPELTQEDDFHGTLLRSVGYADF